MGTRHLASFTVGSRNEAGSLVPMAAALAIATVASAETNDFWDTSGRAADVTSSVASTWDGFGAPWFETMRGWSSETSDGADINTFPRSGLRVIIR